MHGETPLVVVGKMNYGEIRAGRCLGGRRPDRVERSRV